jgi:hypothetical protein
MRIRIRYHTAIVHLSAPITKHFYTATTPTTIERIPPYTNNNQEEDIKLKHHIHQGSLWFSKIVVLYLLLGGKKERQSINYSPKKRRKITRHRPSLTEKKSNLN